MKPYSYDREEVSRKATGCCPEHDWPATYRWCSCSISSRGAREKLDKYNKMGKRARRRRDKQQLRSISFEE